MIEGDKMFTLIGHGYFLVLHSNAESDMPRVARRIAQSAWALFEISATDLVLLRVAAERELTPPHLESLRCLRIGRNRHNLAA